MVQPYFREYKPYALGFMETGIPLLREGINILDSSSALKNRKLDKSLHLKSEIRSLRLD